VPWSNESRPTASSRLTKSDAADDLPSCAVGALSPRLKEIVDALPLCSLGLPLT
jgi:hypothetical protein